MIRDDIIRIAQEAGAMTGTGSIQFRLDGSLERFFNDAYAAGAKDEREACAKVCDIESSVNVTNASEQYQEGRSMGAASCAAGIRARGKK